MQTGGVPLRRPAEASFDSNCRPLLKRTPHEVNLCWRGLLKATAEYDSSCHTKGKLCDMALSIRDSISRMMPGPRILPIQSRQALFCAVQKTTLSAHC